jgi:triacylglycerol lipase
MTTTGLSPLLNLPLRRAAYSDRTSWYMARCSQLAYTHFEDGQEPQLRSDLKELDLQFVRGFAQNKTCAFLACNDRFAVLAFRGTEQNKQNILSDIDIRFHRDKSGAKTATGFSQAYALVAKEIADAIDTLDPGLPLYITGHSLGGALAAIASTRIRPSDRIAACYTYGCPRVGNAEFVDELWKVPVYRQVHSSDIVPRAPFGFGYLQAGDLRYIKRSGTLVEDPNSIGYFLSFFASFLTLLIGRMTVFENHRIAGYVDALRAWALTRLDLEKDSTSTHSTAPPKSLTASPGAVP